MKAPATSRSTVKAEVTAKERAARVDAFRHMAQDDYNHLLRVIAIVVPPQMCDPADALSAGLLAATRMYNGDTKLVTYVSKCAFNYALWQARKNRAILFSDLPVDPYDNEDSYIAETLFATVENPRYVEAIDDRFIERIEEILDQSIDYRQRKTRPKVIALAHDILTMYRENANLGYGIGIDEYENAPLKRPDYQGQFRLEQNTIQPLAEIRKHIGEVFHAYPCNVKYAQTALRESARQALHEGWLR